MTIHNRDRPDAPVRVRKSTLNAQVWLWACWTNATTSSGHRGHGYPSWDDAFAAMETHRRSEHGEAS